MPSYYHSEGTESHRAMERARDSPWVTTLGLEHWLNESLLSVYLLYT